jgi:hypothetical protein
VGSVIWSARGFQEIPSVAFGGSNHLVTWLEYRFERYEIFGVLVDKEGTAVDQPRIPISTAK